MKKLLLILLVLFVMSNCYSENKISMQFDYNISSSEVLQVISDVSTNELGTITFSKPKANLQSTYNKCTVELKSKNRISGLINNEIIGTFTAKFINIGTSETRQVAGLFSNTDGFSIGTSNEVFGIYRYDNQIRTFISREFFSINTIEMYSREVLNAFRIKIGNLYNTVTFEILSGEIWTPFHRIDWSNAHNNALVTNNAYNLAFRITKTGEVNTVEIETTGGYVDYKYNSEDSKSFRYFSKYNNKQVLGYTITNILSLKSTTEFFNVENNVATKILSIDYALNNSDNIVNLYILQQASLNGTSAWYPINRVNSVIWFDTSATSVVSYDKIIKTIPLLVKNGSVNLEKDNIYFYQGDKITFASESTQQHQITINVNFRNEF